ncbi:core protein [Kosakonia phage Kc166A]|uniref:Core protein n=1 Tax=Kosakonia phage Kc166A TaxID=2801381 RepID=A0AAE7UWR2_9CAUD|nr:core protein [Kosakonia phage Kc166A]
MHIRKATLQDVSRIVITGDDLMEFEAYNPNRDLTATLISHLTESSVVLINNGSVLAYGGNSGDCVWFLTDDRVNYLTYVEKLCMLEQIKAYRDLMLDQYGTIWNYVWINNKSHIKFLKRLGAEFHEEWSESPVTGERFQLFTIRRENV